MPGGNASVFFSQTSALAGTFATNSARGTAPIVKKIQSAFQVAQWGEDNRFPQNIERLMGYCGIGKAALDWKARALMGGGIIPGTVDGMDDKGEEIFKPLDYQKNRQVYNFIRSREFNRFLLEYTQDWVWFGNCFPELVLDNECKKITNIVHQESCDARFKQMNDSGVIESVYLSKIWGLASDQFAKFDPKKKPKNLIENPENLTEAESKYVATLDCIDMYDALESTKAIAEKLKSGNKKVKSAILPVNYPSVNKTYYQVPAWDGARLAGWIEIACKIPSLLKSMYSKAFNIKYHIEIPESYFPKKFGPETWEAMDDEKRKTAKKNLLEEMNEFLSGDENAYKTFVSFFDVSPHDHTEHSRIKITPIESKNNIDKELLTSSAAELQILISMQVNPTIFGAGTVGTGSQRSGGSDIRESFLVHSALLAHERQIMLEPLYLVRDFNEWGEDIVFRFRDTVLTTLDTGAGSKKVVS
ncbi:hypothetical protein ACFOWM_03460 [Ferruginibacter yonginensis]|uniref:Uncharacterized protein n=1 Tax=Ferruginibacter yonginensis TaxID=1310416 RepID=A0ABV8QNR3_9BACT